MPYIEKQCSSRQSTIQAVAYTSVAAATTAAFGAETFQIRLASTSNCYYLVSEAASVTTATSANASYLPSTWVEYLTVTPGQKLSVVQSTTGGTLNVTELT